MPLLAINVSGQPSTILGTAFSHTRKFPRINLFDPSLKVNIHNFIAFQTLVVNHKSGDFEALFALLKYNLNSQLMNSIDYSIDY